MNKIMVQSVCLSMLILFFCVPSFASNFPNYSANQIKSKLDSGEDIFLLCPLSDIVFNEKSIPGSTNIPLAEIMKAKTLPRDKGTEIITYCLGPK